MLSFISATIVFFLFQILGQTSFCISIENLRSTTHESRPRDHGLDRHLGRQDELSTLGTENNQWNQAAVAEDLGPTDPDLDMDDDQSISRESRARRIFSRSPLPPFQPFKFAKSRSNRHQRTQPPPRNPHEPPHFSRLSNSARNRAASDSTAEKHKQPARDELKGKLHDAELARQQSVRDTPSRRKLADLEPPKSPFRPSSPPSQKPRLVKSFKYSPTINWRPARSHSNLRDYVSELSPHERSLVRSKNSGIPSISGPSTTSTAHDGTPKRAESLHVMPSLGFGLGAGPGKPSVIHTEQKDTSSSQRKISELGRGSKTRGNTSKRYSRDSISLNPAKSQVDTPKLGIRKLSGQKQPKNRGIRLSSFTGMPSKLPRMPKSASQGTLLFRGRRGSSSSGRNRLSPNKPKGKDSGISPSPPTLDLLAQHNWEHSGHHSGRDSPTPHSSPHPHTPSQSAWNNPYFNQVPMKQHVHNPEPLSYLGHSPPRRMSSFKSNPFSNGRTSPQLKQSHSQTNLKSKAIREDNQSAYEWVTEHKQLRGNRPSSEKTLLSDDFEDQRSSSIGEDSSSSRRVRKANGASAGQNSSRLQSLVKQEVAEYMQRQERDRLKKARLEKEKNERKFLKNPHVQGSAAIAGGLIVGLGGVATIGSGVAFYHIGKAQEQHAQFMSQNADEMAKSAAANNMTAVANGYQTPNGTLILKGPNAANGTQAQQRQHQ